MLNNTTDFIDLSRTFLKGIPTIDYNKADILTAKYSDIIYPQIDKLGFLRNKVYKQQVKINNIKDIICAGSVDAVTVNPPYKKRGSGIINEKDTKTISRHEISCTLEDIIKESARILKSGGSMYMIHKSERLVDALCSMRKEKIEPKRIRFIHPSMGQAPNLVLIEGVRSGGNFLKIENPLYVYDTEGNYTEEIKKIYGLL